MCRSFNSQIDPKGLPSCKINYHVDRALAAIRGTGDQKKSTLKSPKNPLLPNHICSSLHQYIPLQVFSPAVFLSSTAPNTRSAYRAKYHSQNITESIQQPWAASLRAAQTWNSLAHWKKSLMSTSQPFLKCRIYKMYDQLPKMSFS